MTIENTEAFLKKFGYNFTRNTNELTVKMPFSQSITLNFPQEETVHITNKLNSWNYLSGFIKLELKQAFIFNLILGVIIGIGLSLYDLKLGLGAFIVTLAWSVLWALTYKARSERFKQFLLNWDQQHAQITA